MDRLLEPPPRGFDLAELRRVAGEVVTDEIVVGELLDGWEEVSKRGFQSAARLSAGGIRPVNPAREFRRVESDAEIGSPVGGGPVAARSMDGPLQFEDQMKGAEGRLDAIQLIERLAGIAQFQPTGGSAEVM